MTGLVVFDVRDPRYRRGVKAPDNPKGTSDWRAPLGSPANTRRVRAAGAVVSVEAALSRAWRHDAHAVAYATHGPDGEPLERQPRVTKEGLAWVQGQGFGVTASTLLADVDCPDHGAWTPSLRTKFDAAFAASPTCSTAGLFFTAHGARIVQPLASPLDVEAFERVLGAWLLRLRNDGIAADLGCRDWTRFFRLPLVMRDGVRTATIVDTSHMVAVALEVPPAEPERAPRRRGAPRPVAGFVDTLDDAWRERVVPVVAVMAAIPLGTRHATSLAIAGALLQLRVSPELVPALASHMANAAGWDGGKALVDARSTVDRWAQRSPHTRLAWLERTAPDVATALRRVVIAPRVVDASVPTLDADGVSAAMVDVMSRARAGHGVQLVQAPCGAGKTRAACAAAAERAAKEHADGRPAHEHPRDPLGSHTAIAEPTTRLAVEVTARARRDHGLAVRRDFGVLSVKNADGEPACRVYESARPMSDGGQSIPLAYCRPCPHRETCAAYAARDEDDGARVAVGPHAMLGGLAAFAGTTGLLVVDEPGALVHVERLTSAELRQAVSELGHFERAYADALRPVLQGLDALIGEGRAREPKPLADVLGAARPAASALARIEANQIGGHAPPVLRLLSHVSRSRPELARTIGAASDVCRTVREALLAPGATVAVDTFGGAHAVVVWLDATLEAVLRRDGATVLVGADVGLMRDAVAAVVGYVPQLHAFDAVAGCNVHRQLLRTRATRRAWFAGEELAANSTLLAALRHVEAWAAPLEQVGIATFKRLAVVLRLARGEAVDDAPAWAAAWAARVRATVPTLCTRPGVAVGHFGGLRGLDAWAAFDGVATLGDAHPHLGDAEAVAAHLGVDVDVHELAAAEAEQAHGRLRTIRRSKPAHMLHVGKVVPRGWRDMDVHELAPGRPANAPPAPSVVEALRACVAAAGSARAAAAALGLNDRAVRRYIDGERGVPEPVQAKLREFGYLRGEGGAAENPTMGGSSIVGVSAAPSAAAPVEPTELLTGDELRTRAAETRLRQRARGL